MKRYIVSMSFSRQKALKIMSGQGDPFAEHICKIVLYRDIRYRYIDDWEKSIAKAIYNIRDITVTPKNRKPKDEDIIESLLGYLGTTRSDSRNILVYFNTKLSRLDVNLYPEVDIDDEKIDILRAMSDKFMDTIPEFVKNLSEDSTLDECKNYVMNIIDKELYR